MRHKHGVARGQHRSGASRVGGVPSVASQTLPTPGATARCETRLRATVARRPNRNQNEPLTAPNQNASCRLAHEWRWPLPFGNERREPPPDRQLKRVVDGGPPEQVTESSGVANSKRLQGPRGGQWTRKALITTEAVCTRNAKRTIDVIRLQDTRRPRSSSADIYCEI